MRIAEIINEAFETPFEYERISPDYHYVSEMYKFFDAEGSAYAVFFTGGGELGFSRLEDPDKLSSQRFALKGEKGSIRVYSTVLKIIEDYIVRVKPKFLKFEPYDVRTEKLYIRFAQHVEAKYGLKMGRDDSYITMGDKYWDL